MKERLQQAVPPMPDHFAKRMTDTLGGLEDVRRGRKLTVSVAVALAAMLALAGMACAARMGILDFIFVRALPGADSAKAVKAVDISAKSEYMDFTVHEYVFDGTDLYADWTLQMHTDEPLVLISTGMDADFEQDVYSAQPDPGSIKVNNPMTDSFDGGVWSGMNRGHFYDFTPEEPFEVTMQLALVRPDEGVPMLNSCEIGEYPRQPVWFGVDDEVCWSWGYYETETEAGSDDWEHYEQIDARAAEVGYHEAWLEYFEEYGFGTVVDRLEVKFTVVPEGWSGRRLEKSETFRLKDFDLAVEKAEFSGFSARIDLKLVFAETETSAMDRRIVFDVYADGQPLELAQQMEMFGEAPTEAVYALWSDGGCALLPDEIALETGGQRITIDLK